jgi:PAS domain S-box-containing protein
MSESFSLIGRDYRVLDVNAAAVALDGRSRSALVDHVAWELQPGLEESPVGEAIKRVMESRNAETLRYLQDWGDGRSAWLDVRVLPVQAGVALFYKDVTEDVIRTDELRATTQRLNGVLNNTTMAVFVMDHRQHCAYANKAAEQLTGYAFEQMQGRPLHDVVHHKKPDGSHYPLEECPIDRAFPERMQMQGEELFVAPDGSFYPVAFTASPLLGEAGQPVGTIIEAKNVAGEKANEKRMEAQARTLETINRTGAAIASELELERVVQIATDAAVDLTGAAFGAFFYNVIDNAGEKFLLYTLSGARREDFERFGMPRATAIFHPTFVGEGVVRSDNIREDPRYGKSAPHHGMPEGHLPVTSYLAVSVQSRSGEVIGGLFLGHPEELASTSTTSN